MCIPFQGGTFDVLPVYFTLFCLCVYGLEHMVIAAHSASCFVCFVLLLKTENR